MPKIKYKSWLMRGFYEQDENLNEQARLAFLLFDVGLILSRAVAEVG